MCEVVRYKIKAYAGVEGDDRIISTQDERLINAINLFRPEEVGIEILERTTEERPDKGGN